VKLFFSIIGAATFLLSHTSYCQNSEKNLSFNGGLNLAHPTFIYFNEDSFEKSIPSYQLGFNKDFFSKSAWGLSLSVNLSKNSFNAGRQVGSFYSIKQLDLSYLSVEGGASYRIPIKNIAFWCSTNLRLGRLIAQNYNDYYTVPTLKSSDIGLNFRLGCEIMSIPSRPYLLLNYYYGLSKIAENSVTTGNGQTLNDYIRNRTIGVQISFHF
jgi:hypothetical protein